MKFRERENEQTDSDTALSTIHTIHVVSVGWWRWWLGPGRPGSLGWCRLVNLGEDDLPGLGTAAA